MRVSTFQKLYEASQRDAGRDFWDEPQDNSEDLDDNALSVIKRGLEIRPDRVDGETFWDDFLLVVTNNASKASNLLGVPQDVISKWARKIRQGLEEVRRENDQSPKRKKEMMSTGDLKSEP